MVGVDEHLELTVADDAVLRTFVGIQIPHGGELLDALLDDRELQACPVRWSLPDNLHITLAFLGEVPGHMLKEMWPLLAGAVSGLRSFPVAFTGPRPFPGPANPRIVAVEVRDVKGPLTSLQSAVAAACAQAQVPIDERSFRPHVSLGRLRLPLLRGQASALAMALQGREWPVVESFFVQSVSAFRSDLFPDGARYVVVGRASLVGRQSQS